MIAMLAKKKPLAPADKGFTLLEVMIAVAILAISLGAILAIEGNSINATARAKQINAVAVLERNQMIETEFKIRGKTFDEVKKEESGTFEAPYQDFRWKTTIKEIKFPTFPGLNQGSSGKPTASGGSASGPGSGETDMSQMISKLMTNFFSKAMREVTITVLWKFEGKEQNFSLSTYWVDLNHEFNLSE